ncbi:MAG: TIGR04086 family membrane protein [Ruminococcus sp.]|nr:TIGR04086 family membrane protein [Ruminococcus sp.]
MRRHRQSPWSNTLFSLGVSVLCGSAAMLASAAVLSALSYFVLASTQFIGFFAALSAAVGGFTAGYICGRYRRRFGLLGGIACGALLYGLLSAIGTASLGAPADIKKLLLLTVAGAAGGVAGVNSKRPRSLT